MQVVLEGRPREKEAEWDGEPREGGAEAGGFVLEPMTLVDRDGVEQERLCEEGLLGSESVILCPQDAGRDSVLGSLLRRV